MTTTLTDKQPADARVNAIKHLRAWDFASMDDYWDEADRLGDRAVADLAITQADSEIHGLKAELALFQKPDK